MFVNNQDTFTDLNNHDTFNSAADTLAKSSFFFRCFVTILIVGWLVAAGVHVYSSTKLCCGLHLKFVAMGHFCRN